MFDHYTGHVGYHVIYLCTICQVVYSSFSSWSWGLRAVLLGLSLIYYILFNYIKILCTDCRMYNKDNIAKRYTNRINIDIL